MEDHDVDGLDVQLADVHCLPDADLFVAGLLLLDATDVPYDLAVCDDPVYDDVLDDLGLRDVDLRDVDVHLLDLVLFPLFDDDRLAENVSLGVPHVDLVDTDVIDLL